MRSEFKTIGHSLKNLAPLKDPFVPVVFQDGYKLVVADTKSIEYKHTQSAQWRLIKTDTTERLLASLEVEQQGY